MCLIQLVQWVDMVFGDDDQQLVDVAEEEDLTAEARHGLELGPELLEFLGRAEENRNKKISAGSSRNCCFLPEHYRFVVELPEFLDGEERPHDESVHDQQLDELGPLQLQGLRHYLGQVHVAKGVYLKSPK